MKSRPLAQATKRTCAPFPPLNSKGTVHHCIHDNSRVLLHNSSAEQWRGRGLNTSVVTLTWLTNSFDTPLSYPTTFLKGADSSLAVCGKKSALK